MKIKLWSCWPQILSATQTTINILIFVLHKFYFTLKKKISYQVTLVIWISLRNISNSLYKLTTGFPHWTSKHQKIFKIFILKIINKNNKNVEVTPVTKLLITYSWSNTLCSWCFFYTLDVTIGRFHADDSHWTTLPMVCWTIFLRDVCS